MKNVLQCIGYDLLYPNIIKAENCTLYDEHGETYLDLESGIWCTSVGHSNPGISRVIKEQSEKIMHTGYCYANPVIQKTSEKLLEITGIGEGKCLYLCSGSEAVELSGSIARAVSDKPCLLTLKDSYLSAFGSAGKKEAEDWILLDWQKGESLEQIPFEKIAAFIFEPGSSSGLVHFPPEELINEIVTKVRAHKGLIIANEVTTGIGRTGEWFGYNHYNIIPDITAIGKGLGNGYPVSTVALSQHVARQVDSKGFHYSQSHQNDPLGAAVAHEVISIIEKDNLLAECRKKGEKLKEGLNKIKENFGIIKEVRGRGLMLAIEFEQNSSVSYAHKINSELIKEKILLLKRPGLEIFRLNPALTIENPDIETFLSTFEAIISRLT